MAISVFRFPFPLKPATHAIDLSAGRPRSSKEEARQLQARRHSSAPEVECQIAQFLTNLMPGNESDADTAFAERRPVRRRQDRCVWVRVPLALPAVTFPLLALRLWSWRRRQVGAEGLRGAGQRHGPESWGIVLFGSEGRQPIALLVEPPRLYPAADGPVCRRPSSFIGLASPSCPP